MKKYPNTHIIIGILSMTLLMLWGPEAFAQKKERLRLTASYSKITDGPSYLDLRARARIDKTNVNISDITLNVFYELDGEEFELGEVITDYDGKARFTLKGLEEIRPDSTGLYILGASFSGNDSLRRASRSVEFRDGAINASIKEVDSTSYVVATLKDAKTDSLIADAMIKVQVERMFKPLLISKDLLMTDEEGSIMVPVPGDIPGKDGMLNLEVVIEENDTYGTVKTVIEAPLGTPIVVDNTYNERTLWGTRGNTPLFILFFTGVLIIGSWGLIIYLIMNLFKIAKN
ncbi:MAG: hypothetical protein R3356_06615 [Eudoraea sp.]|nr:hypothetical protein [Eudoraea sp.]